VCLSTLKSWKLHFCPNCFLTVFHFPSGRLGIDAMQGRLHMYQMPCLIVPCQMAQWLIVGYPLHVQVQHAAHADVGACVEVEHGAGKGEGPDHLPYMLNGNAILDNSLAGKLFASCLQRGI